MSDTEFESDLFKHPEEQPHELRCITDKYCEKLATGEGDPYDLCRDFLSEVEALGFTFNYGLDGEPHQLRQIDDHDVELGLPRPTP